MVDIVNLQPKMLDLSLYAGDGLVLKLICKDNASVPIEVTGIVEGEIRLTRIAEDPPVVEFDINLDDAAEGIILVLLTGAQTRELSDHTSARSGKFKGFWDLQWTATASEPRTLCQGKVECLPDVTR